MNKINKYSIFHYKLSLMVLFYIKHLLGNDLMGVIHYIYESKQNSKSFQILFIP